MSTPPVKANAKSLVFMLIICLALVSVTVEAGSHLCVQVVPLTNWTQTVVVAMTNKNVTESESVIDVIPILIVKNQSENCKYLENLTIKIDPLNREAKDWLVDFEILDAEAMTLLAVISSPPNTTFDTNHTLWFGLALDGTTIIQEINHTVTLRAGKDDTHPTDLDYGGFLTPISELSGGLVSFQLRIDNVRRFGNTTDDILVLESSSDMSDALILAPASFRDILGPGSVVRITGIIRQPQTIVARNIEPVHIPIFISVTAVIAILSLLTLLLMSLRGSSPPKRKSF